MIEFLIDVFSDSWTLGFYVGVLAATVFCYLFHRKQKKDWQAEYRRLMGGIKWAMDNVVNLNQPRGFVATRLRKIYNDEPIWPRK